MGISLLDADNSAHASLIEKIKESQVERDARQRRLKLLRRLNPKKSEAELLKMLKTEGKSAPAASKQKKRWFAGKS